MSGFYLALLDQAHYYESACGYASPRFHLTEGKVPAGPAQGGVPGAKPPDGGCPELAEYWHSRYGHLVGASGFSVSGVAVKGRTAEATTPFGRVGLEVVGGEWKLLWVTV